MSSREAAPAYLERLWAPWRAGYIRCSARPAKACIFCFGRLSASERRRRLVLWAGPAAMVMLNRYPYNNGHVMVAPRRHRSSPELLTEQERQALTELMCGSLEILRRALKPSGFNLGANVGRVAGAGFAAHFHWHIVPRWDGDTNFMPTVAGTKIISQHLNAGFDLLSPMFEALTAGAPQK